MIRLSHFRRGAARCAPSRQSFQRSAVVVFCLCFVSVMFLVPVLAHTQKEQRSTKHDYAEETESETLWRGRFADCDFGFYVLLPNKFVGHGNSSENPGHGFLVGLPDTATINPVGIEDDRFIWVNAEHNSLEWKSLDEATDGEISFRKKKPDFKILDRDATRLNGRATTRVRLEYNSPKGKVIEEQITALRSGILYEIGLRTTPSNYHADKIQFTRIVNNFRWWRIHYCP
jgi:hypothetical protein